MRNHIRRTVTGILVLTLCVLFNYGRAYGAAIRLNQFPIILVHAWSGERPGTNAWGGTHCDLPADLTAHGHTTFKAYMGPFSSSWDRACELYAQIMGGTVDYGLAHAKKYHHARYGNTYEGFYPQWGQEDPESGAINKVHLIGKCYGGLTARLLIQLLEKGYEEEREATPPDGLSPLFKGGHSWVLSCTTIATPHDGLSILDFYLLRNASNTDLLRFIMVLCAPYATTTGYQDLMLGHWGFQKLSGETLDQFVQRLAEADFFKRNKDFSNYEMLPAGIYALNSWVKAQPDVYYFSLGNQATWKDRKGRHHPLLSVVPAWYAASDYIGAHTRNNGYFTIDRTWFPNDGLVSTVTMNGPKTGAGAHDRIVEYNGTPAIGTWNYLGTLMGLDHGDIVGADEGWFPRYDPLPWFLGHAELLESLPR